MMSEKFVKITESMESCGKSEEKVSIYHVYFIMLLVNAYKSQALRFNFRLLMYILYCL